MIVGTEWLIEAFDCEAEILRDVSALQTVFAEIIKELGLKTIGDGSWHKFGGEGGVTGLTMLTESHLACHTYPEHQTATFNLYCCRSRPEWDWQKNLRKILGAQSVNIQKVERGKTSSAAVPVAVTKASRLHESNAAVPVAVTKASRLRSNFPEFNFKEINQRKRGYLPDWEKEEGIYFVTFRLEDSLPKNVVNQIRFERELYEKNITGLTRQLKPAEKRRMEKLFSEKFDEYLDAGSGHCYLKNPEIAGIVEESLKHHDDEKYRLFAWCVMPNHVHVLFQVLSRHSLSEITHSWKSFTAHKANNILGLSGAFWQRESFDHLVRDEMSFYEIAKYILDNPVKAKLKNWRWVGIQNISENRLEMFLEDSEVATG